MLSEQEQIRFNKYTQIRKRGYILTCGKSNYTINCPEIHANGVKYLCIAEFSIPGRPYPIYVYIYGIILYSTNPKMGQREAAEKTRIQFGLTTFSHTTLGRAMIRLELWIKTFDDTPESEGLSSNLDKPDTISTVTGKEVAETEHNGYLPSVNNTRQRRKNILAFLTKAAKKDAKLTKSEKKDIQLTETEEQDSQLTQDVLQSSQNYARLPYKGAFFDMCHRIVDHTFKKYCCLLL